MSAHPLPLPPDRGPKRTAIRSRCLLATAIVLFGQIGLADAQTYRWKDPKTGRTVISDQPPPAGVKPARRSGQGIPSEGAAAGGSVPYAVREAMRDFPVRLFTAPGCKNECQEARLLLQGRGIPYSEESVATREAVDNLKRLAGQDAVPVLQVGQQVVVGMQLGRWNQTLDLAGYPKTAYAGYRPPPLPVEAVMPPPAAADTEPPVVDSPAEETPSPVSGTPDQ